MQSKQDAIAQIITLMDEHQISILEIKNALPQTVGKRGLDATKKLFAIIGGIFIACGIFIYVAQHWGMLNLFARIIITLGSGVILYLFAIIASFDERYAKMTSVLFFIAIIFEAFGLVVASTELFQNSMDTRYLELAICAIISVQQILTMQRIRNEVVVGALVLFSTLFFTVMFNLIHISDKYNATIIGLALIVLSSSVITNSNYHRLAPVWYLIGSIAFLCGAFSILQDTSIEIIYLGISAFIIYLSTIFMSRMLLLTGAIAMISYISYFSSIHFPNSVGWPITLIICGIFILVIGAVSLNINKRIK